MAELKKALGTEVDVTVFRKLKHLAYRTSYSHGGSYYTLDETARFDESGLWSFHSVWFSRQGTLLATAEAFIEGSEGGYWVEELDHLLHVGTRAPLLRLVQQKRIAGPGNFLAASLSEAAMSGETRETRFSNRRRLCVFGNSSWCRTRNAFRYFSAACWQWNAMISRRRSTSRSSLSAAR